MELIQQLEKWDEQVATAGANAVADMDVAKRLLKHGIEALDEIEMMRGLILRACAELETVEYECDPPSRVVALMDELRAVNRAALLTRPT